MSGIKEETSIVYYALTYNYCFYCPPSSSLANSSNFSSVILATRSLRTSLLLVCFPQNCPRNVVSDYVLNQ